MNNETTKFSVKALKGAIGFVDSIGRNKYGHIVVRRGFFYTNGGSAGTFRDYVVAELERAGIAHEVVSHGEQWTAFRGGASVAHQSHWWVTLRSPAAPAVR